MNVFGRVKKLEDRVTTLEASMHDMQERVAERLITSVELRDDLTDALRPVYERLTQQDTLIAEIHAMLVIMVNGPNAKT